MTSQYRHLLRGVGLAVALSALACWAPACEQTEASFSAGRKAHVIQDLEAAKELNLSKANTDIGPVERNDFMVQAHKADRAIRELRSGFEVPQAELQDALMVPNEPLSSRQTARLIEKLKEAKELDDRGISDYGVDPVIAQDFAVQEEEADKVIRDLEIGEPVPRSEVLAALHVPPNP